MKNKHGTFLNGTFFNPQLWSKPQILTVGVSEGVGEYIRSHVRRNNLEVLLQWTKQKSQNQLDAQCHLWMCNLKCIVRNGDFNTWQQVRSCLLFANKRSWHKISKGTQAKAQGTGPIGEHCSIQVVKTILQRQWCKYWISNLSIEISCKLLRGLSKWIICKSNPNELFCRLSQKVCGENLHSSVFSQAHPIRVTRFHLKCHYREGSGLCVTHI